MMSAREILAAAIRAAAPDALWRDAAGALHTVGTAPAAVLYDVAAREAERAESFARMYQGDPAAADAAARAARLRSLAAEALRLMEVH